MDPGNAPVTLYCGECGRPTPADELANFGQLKVCPACKNNYAQKLREGVAAAVVFRYGGFWIRFVAVIIDSIITNLIGGMAQFAILGSFVPLGRVSPEIAPEVMFARLAGPLALSVAIATAIHACYEAFFVYKLGATPGKLALGLKVVRPDGGPVSLGRAFGRYFAKWLSTIILLIGYIMAGFDSQKRALHDMICDTRVIKTRDI
jgi:uncharacterized RDD family membrane protein YckC